MSSVLLLNRLVVCEPVRVVFVEPPPPNGNAFCCRLQKVTHCRLAAPADAVVAGPEEFETAQIPASLARSMDAPPFRISVTEPTVPNLAFAQTMESNPVIPLPMP